MNGARREKETVVKMLRYLTAVLALLTLPALAGEPSNWGSYPPEIQSWFPTVMQPGREASTSSQSSCCGISDAFEGKADGDDQFGNIRVVIPQGRGIIPNGTVVYAPRAKIQVNYGNPLGLLIVFISMGDHTTVYCLVPAIQG